MLRRTSAIATLFLLAIAACDEAPPSGPKLTAGSFALAGACGSIATNATGQLFIWSRTAQTSWHVDKREYDGTPVWSVQLPGVTGCRGAVTTNGDLLTASEDSVYLLSGSSGAAKWKRELRFVNAFAIAANNNVYVTNRSSSLGPSTVVALNGSTGTTLWTQVLTRGGAPYLNDLTSTLYIARFRGFETYNPSTGAPGWASVIPNSYNGEEASIAQNGNLIIISGGDFASIVEAYSPDGDRLWFNTGGSPAQSNGGAPIIDKAGTVYASYGRTSGFSGSVIAMSPATGQTQWKKEFYAVASDIVVDSSRTVFAIAQENPDSAFRLYGLRDGTIVSKTVVDGIGVNEPTRRLLLHPNGLLYYIGTDRISFVPTAGIGSNSVWPMSKHDPLRTARKTVLVLPE